MTNNFIMAIISILECLSVITISDALLKRKYHGKLPYFITVVFYVGAVILTTWLFSYYGLKWLIGMLHICLIGFILYEGKLLAKITYGVLIFVTLYLLDLMSAALLMLLYQISFESAIMISYYPIIGAVISKCLFFFFAKLFQHLRHRKQICLHFTDWIWLSIMEVALLYVMAEVMWNNIADGAMTASTLISVICLIIMNVFLFFLAEKISDRYIAYQQAELLQQQIHMEQRHLKEIDDAYRKIGTHLHDTKNHYLSLQGILQAGNCQLADRYIANLIGDFQTLPSQIKSGSIIFDSLINPKLIVASEKGIIVHLNLSGLDKLRLDEMDFITLAGNLIDNALEACERFEQSEAIHIKLIQDENKFILSVSNPVKEDIAILNNEIKTSKTSEKCHGYGFANIRTVLQKYNGDLQLSCEDKTFRIVVIIYNLIPKMTKNSPKKQTY